MRPERRKDFEHDARAELKGSDEGIAVFLREAAERLIPEADELRLLLRG